MLELEQILNLYFKLYINYNPAILKNNPALFLYSSEIKHFIFCRIIKYKVIHFESKCLYTLYILSSIFLNRFNTIFHCFKLTCQKYFIRRLHEEKNYETSLKLTGPALSPWNTHQWRCENGRAERAMQKCRCSPWRNSNGTRGDNWNVASFGR